MMMLGDDPSNARCHAGRVRMFGVEIVTQKSL